MQLKCVIYLYQICLYVQFFKQLLSAGDQMTIIHEEFMSDDFEISLD